jgi:hypothetical protein
MKRAEAMAYRIRAQQLDRPAADRELTDAAILDFGVQDTGRDGASWALANRGVSLPNAEALEASSDVALAWTLRGAPHFYRRDDLADVLVAVSPFSDKDAAKRVFDAAKPLKAAGIGIRDGLTEVATQLRAVVTKPMVKGEVSTELTKRLSQPYVRWCVPCQATHSWEQPFRLGALYAGLELEPGTSPPVMRRIPGWPKRKPGPAPDPSEAPARLQPIPAYLRFLGPATPNHVAAFLDSPVAEVKAHWPKDAIEVSVDGVAGWLLADHAEAVESAGTDAGSREAHPGLDQVDELVRLLGGFDLFLQGRDRELIVPDASRHKVLWPILGRPGAVLSGTDIVGTWRPRAVGSAFTLRLSLWGKVSKAVRARIEAEAERLANHRGLSLSGIEEE